MNNRWTLIIGCFWTALFGVILTLAFTHAEPPRPLPTVESPEPPLAPPLNPDDERLFARLRPHIERAMVDAVNEAAGDKKTGVGTALAAALGRLVLKLVEGAVAAIIIAAVVALLWSHWYLIAAFFSAVAAVGWLGGKKAASK